jgi:hypothetical protein
MPILLYGTECCELKKRVLSSLDFTVVRFFMKIFRSTNRENIEYIMNMFSFQLPSESVGRRQIKFRQQFSCCENDFCRFIVFGVST